MSFEIAAVSSPCLLWNRDCQINNHDLYLDGGRIVFDDILVIIVDSFSFFGYMHIYEELWSLKSQSLNSQERLCRQSCWRYFMIDVSLIIGESLKG